MRQADDFFEAILPKVVPDGLSAKGFISLNAVSPFSANAKSNIRGDILSKLLLCLENQA